MAIEELEAVRASKQGHAVTGTYSALGKLLTVVDLLRRLPLPALVARPSLWRSLRRLAGLPAVGVRLGDDEVAPQAVELVAAALQGADSRAALVRWLVEIDRLFSKGELNARSYLGLNTAGAAMLARVEAESGPATFGDPLFFSYSRTDRALVEKVHQAYMELGGEAICDLADFSPGQVIADAVRSSLSRAGGVVVFVSSRARQRSSLWVGSELALASAGPRPVAIQAVMLDDVLIPAYARLRVALHAVDRSAQQIAEALRSMIGQSAQTAG